jgi:hypothetical protein
MYCQQQPALSSMLPGGSTHLPLGFNTLQVVKVAPVAEELVVELRLVLLTTAVMKKAAMAAAVMVMKKKKKKKKMMVGISLRGERVAHSSRWSSAAGAEQGVAGVGRGAVDRCATSLES